MSLGPVAATAAPSRSLLLGRRGLLSPRLSLHPLCRPQRALAEHSPTGIMSNHVLLRLGATRSSDASDYRIQAPNVDVQEVRRLPPAGGSGSRLQAR